MKTDSNVSQERILIEPLNSVLVRVTLNANETKTETGYSYDSYTKEVINRPALRQMIESNFDAWVESFADAPAPEPEVTVEELLARLEALLA